MIHKFYNIRDARGFSMNHTPIGIPAHRPFIYAHDDEMCFYCGDDESDEQFLFSHKNLWTMYPEDVEDRLNTIRLDLKGN